ncbi:internal scaffolding protein [Peromfec virus RodF8_40]|uniref:Internal scaffolding protein n=1 Tax=Peromfec virus RodF8_40 TaxID=2929374 RepID=A0A976N2R6_9VIRU|nr:internal scaffolding protein [Peromfec virus RodF8_40]
MTNLFCPPGSSSDPFDYCTSYTRAASTSDAPSAKDGASVIPPGVIYANKQKTLVFLGDNPVCTDVSQREQSDLKILLKNNPDINGLALQLDEDEKKGASLTLEDFLPDKQYYDILDLQRFVTKMDNNFQQLPASIRKQFDNNPYQLAAALEDPAKNTSILKNLYDYLNYEPQQNGSTAPPAQASSTSGTQSTTNSESSYEKTAEINKT